VSDGDVVGKGVGGTDGVMVGCAVMVGRDVGNIDGGLDNVGTGDGCGEMVGLNDGRWEMDGAIDVVGDIVSGVSVGDAEMGRADIGALGAAVVVVVGDAGAGAVVATTGRRVPGGSVDGARSSEGIFVVAACDGVGCIVTVGC
jgi:hypothetical protein